MSPPADPYRTLGVAPGASVNEIRSAYRRLAKQYHPDAAGERALPRFLAIQAAYERLVDGDGRLRAPGGASSGAGRRPAEPWRADPGRARATRDAWRARRGRTSQGTGTDTGPGTASAGADPGPRARTGGGTGGSGRSGGNPDGAPPRERRPRGPRKATPGSTTYDEAAEIPRDPEWDGSSWYGPSSRTYWTINPREYADPRKHGPEYQARARRAAGGMPGDDAAAPGADEPAEARAFGPAAPAPEATPETESEGAGSAWRWSGAGRTTTEGGAAEWGTHAWTYDGGDAGPARGTAWTPGRRGPARPGDWPDDRPGDPTGAGLLPDLEALARRASPASLRAMAGRPGFRPRLLLALLGWPPIGYAVGSLIDAATGCASIAAGCTGPLPVLPLAAQPLVIGALFVAPAVAAIAAFATLAALAVALPVAAVLSVGTVPESRVGSTALAAVIAVAWVAALGGAALAGRARSDESDDPSDPSDSGEPGGGARP